MCSLFYASKLKLSFNMIKMRKNDKTERVGGRLGEKVNVYVRIRMNEHVYDRRKERKK